jgi:CMP-N-acetylneuraminic acid synthetase
VAWHGDQVLAVVPARGGSKGIPRKNLREVGGLSLIARTARVIRQLEWIDHAVISTEDEGMREEGRRFGLEAPFARPAALADDHIRGPDVLAHAWTECERIYRVRFEYALYLEPTSPLRRPEDVERTFQVLAEGPFDSACTVSRSPGHFTPHKCLLIDEAGLVRFYLDEGRNITARQQIPPYYYRNGAAYAVKRAPFRHTGLVIGERTAAVVIDRPLINIDDPLELEFADWLLRREASVEPRKTDLGAHASE